MGEVREALICHLEIIAEARRLPVLWSPSYLRSTAGNMWSSTLERYIAEQPNPWMALVRSALNIRLDPTPEQAEALAGFAGARRWVWNWALERRKETYEFLTALAGDPGG